MKEPGIGDKFGRWTVLENIKIKDKHGHNKRYCKCQCECGTIRDVFMYNLLRGITQSCGCIQSENIIGETFGRLTVIGDAEYESGNGKHKRFTCKCECGNTITCRGSDLRAGIKVDCGCGSAEKWSNAKTNDLTGQIFGSLTVIERDKSVPYQGGKHAQWLCKCALCGSITSVASDMLTRYGKDRCSDCIGIPIGESKIKAILDDACIPYKHDTVFKDCIYPDTGYHLRFDFVVNADSDSTYVIEFDGIQHYKPVKHWEASTNLEGRKARDSFKNQWCMENGIQIIRIPYTHINDINLRDLIPESSDFLITKVA